MTAWRNAARAAGLVFVSLAAGCASPPEPRDEATAAVQDLDALVDVQVTEPERRERARAVVTKLADLVDGFFTRFARVQDEAFELHADYSAERIEFDRLYSKIDSIRRRTAEDAIEMVLELRQHVTREEWDAMQHGMAKHR